LRAFREIARLRRVDLPRPADRPTDFAAGAAAAQARGMNRLGEPARGLQLHAPGG
jgi:hypothetical protein